MKPWSSAFFQSDRTKNSKKPIFLGWRSSKEFIIGTVTFGIFVDILLYSIIVPVIPYALVSRANVEESSVQGWISIMLAVYGVGLLVASPIFGWVADHTEYRRAPFLWGLILLGASTAMFCVGNSIGILIAARLVQGMSGGCIWVVGLALVIDTVPATEQAQSMGFVSIGMTAGSSLGPLLGGVIYEKAGYVSVFILAFSVIAVDIIMRILVIEKKAANQWVDQPAIMQQDATTNIDLENQKPSAPLPFNGGTARSLVANIAPTRKKSRIPGLILLLKSPRQLNSLFITIMLGSIFTAFDAILPLRVKYTFNFNATAAGLIFLAIVIPSFLAPLAGKFTDRHGPRWLVVAAFFICMPLFILLRLPSEPKTAHIVGLCAILFGIGLVMASSLPVAMGEISASVVEYEQKNPGIFGDKGAFAQAYALFNIAWSLGSVIGPLYAGFVNKAAGWNNLMLSFGMLCFLTSFVTVWYTGGKITKNDLHWKKKQTEEQEEAGQNSETQAMQVPLESIPESSAATNTAQTASSLAEPESQDTIATKPQTNIALEEGRLTRPSSAKLH